MTEVEKMMRGELYDYSDPEALELNFQAHERLERLNAARYRDTQGYRAALRELIGLTAIPPFQRWLEDMGFVENGKLTALAGGASRVLR